MLEDESFSFTLFHLEEWKAYFERFSFCVLCESICFIVSREWILESVSVSVLYSNSGILYAIYPGGFTFL